MEITRNLSTKPNISSPVQRSSYNPSFTGNKFLETLGSNGSDAGIVTMSSTLLIMLLRPLVIMMDKNATKEEKVHAASWIFGLSAVGFIAQAALKKPFDKIAGTIAKDFFKLETKESIAGAAEVVKFGLYNAAAVVYTYLNSRYVGRLLNKITKKPDEKEKNMTPEQKVKEKKKDKIILTTLAAAAGFIGLNVIGRKLTGRPIASDAVAKVFKNANQFLTKNSQLFRNIKDFVSRKSNQFAAYGKNKAEWFTQQGNLRDGWITRNMIANSIVRPIIALFSGQPYVAIRCFIDEGIGSVIMKFIGDPLTKAATGPLGKLFGNPKTPKEIEGVKVLAGQLVKNVAILCLGLGFLNNYMSKRVVKLLNKFKKEDSEPAKQQEQQYKDFRKNFIPAASLNQGLIKPEEAKNPQEWLMAINAANRIPVVNNNTTKQITG